MVADEAARKARNAKKNWVHEDPEGWLIDKGGVAEHLKNQDQKVTDPWVVVRDATAQLPTGHREFDPETDRGCSMGECLGVSQSLGSHLSQVGHGKGLWEWVHVLTEEGDPEVDE